MDKPDLLILGLDPMGLELAMAAAALGAQVVLSTAGETPLDQSIRDGTFLSMLSAMPGETGRGAFETRRRALIEWLGRTRSVERLRAARVTVETGPVIWQAGRQFTLGDRTVLPRRIVLATGTAPQAPLPALVELLRYGVLPKRVVLRGEGVEAVSLAACLAEAGTKTTLVCTADTLSGFQPEAAALLLQSLQSSGVTIARDLPAPRAADLPIWDVPQREPTLEPFGLDKLGLAVGQGSLELGKSLETPVSRIYAIGNLTVRHFAEMADSAAIGYLLARLLLRKPGHFVRQPAVRSVGSRLAIAEIGLSEDAARSASAAIRIYRATAEEIAPQARLEPSLLTLIANRKGKLLGASLLSTQARTLITPLALAVQSGMSLEQLALMPLAGAGDAQLIRHAARAPSREMIRSPALRRAVSLLRTLG